jgi:glycerol-3-phosphate dehydrogenase
MTTSVPSGSLRATSLNARRRAVELDALAGGEQVDLLVVGGGVTGAGVALDAASRGLSVALIEAHDLAFGTSRWSSKLVHGGLRYLAKGDVPLAHESAAERGVLMSVVAPHLTRPLPQLFPLHREVSAGIAAFTMTGLVAGDALRRAARTPSSVLPAPRKVSGVEALALAPALRRDGLRGGLLSFDGQLTDDARLVVALARTAAGFGARILTRVRALELRRDGAQARDELTGAEFGLRARVVVNATGVWAGRLTGAVRLRPSRGTHLVLDGQALGLTRTALTVPVPGERNRFVLFLPQDDGRCLLGLTDEPLDGPVPDVPAVPESDVEFLLRTGSAVLDRPLTRADVLGSFAGLRPLVAGSAGARSADLSRRHTVAEHDGVLTVVGGKLTTYRRMAADAVDAAATLLSTPIAPTRTDRIPLVGAAPRSRLSTLDAPQRLISRYGTESTRVSALADLDPDLAEPLSPSTAVTAAEVVWAVRHEGALTPDDVLDRRTRIGLVPTDRAAALPQVTPLVTRTLQGVHSA